MPPLTSASIPPVGPADHVRGEGDEVVVYLDLGCPACAATWVAISPLSLRLCVRHFPIASRRPRSPALHAATEAASLQRPEAFWEMADSILRDQGHIDDPHLWERATILGLDLERFDRDRRSDAVASRVRHDFEAAIRGGVAGTPAGFRDGLAIPGDLARALGPQPSL